MKDAIQQKLFNYTEAPPRSAWEGIAAALDETPAYAQKLSQYEQMPPAATWNNIVAQLATPETKVISLRAILFKYAIAAAVLGLIAAGSIFYLKSGIGSNLASQPQNAISTNRSNAPLDTQAQPGAGAPAGEKENAAIAGSGLSTKAAASSQALVHFSPRVRVAKSRLAARAIEIVPEVKAVIDTELADRYMIATTSGGKVVRLPKKAYSDYACAEAYKNYQCKERIASIQNQMAASVATDFTEFIDLLRKLQDNQ